MKYCVRNIRVFATPAPKYGGINIYLDFSGQRKYLTFYRFNYRLYMLLKNGISLDELTRNSSVRATTSGEKAMAHSIRQLLKIIDDYFKYDYIQCKNVV